MRTAIPRILAFFPGRCYSIRIQENAEGESGMSIHEEITSLLQTVGATLRLHPEKAEERLNVLTDVQQENLLRLLKRIAEGGAHAYSFGHGPKPDSREEGKKKDTHGVIFEGGPTPSGPKKPVPIPEPGSYYQTSDHSAICMGCPSGCELTWDDEGGCAGFSCIQGQETGEALAMAAKRKKES